MPTQTKRVHNTTMRELEVEGEYCLFSPLLVVVAAILIGSLLWKHLTVQGRIFFVLFLTLSFGSIMLALTKARALSGFAFRK